MPITFRESKEEAFGLAAFLRVEPAYVGSGLIAALFTINGRGEPVDFTFNEVQIPRSPLWRRSDLRRNAERNLVRSLLSACRQTPHVLFALSDEVSSMLFEDEVIPTIPVGIVSVRKRTDHANSSVSLAEEEALTVAWIPSSPSDATAEGRILRLLRSNRLLSEPFDRASAGLSAVFTEPTNRGA